MKFGPFIAVTIGAGLLVGWLAPSGQDLAQVPAASAEEKASAQLDVLQQDEWSGGELVLARADDGHFYADVMVDGGAPANMMVDTGATIVALTAEDAEAAGVQWSEDQVQPVARGASGTVYGVHVMLGRVQVGDLEAQQVEAIVVPEGLGISLLGQSFLSKIQRVEIEQDRMALGI
jgi:aspartyl protease family protein